MKISSISVNNINFGNKYKTADVLRFVTGYNFHKQNTDFEFFKSLTGIDLFSSPVYNEMAKKYSNFSAYMGVHDVSSEEIFRQCPKVKESIDTFDASLHLKKGRQAQNQWLDEQIKKLGKYLDLSPFKPDEEKIKKSAEETDEMLKNLFV